MSKAGPKALTLQTMTVKKAQTGDRFLHKKKQEALSKMEQTHNAVPVWREDRKSKRLNYSHINKVGKQASA